MSTKGTDSRDIAVVGMACIFPGASDLDAYWSNNVNQVDAITEVPKDRWDSQLFSNLPEDHEVRIVCTRGGFVPRDIGFNPRRFGIVPNVLQHADPDQFVLLHIADAALRDAGIDDGDPIRLRTDTIVGRGGYLSTKMAEVFLRVDSLFRVKPFLKQRFPELSSPDLDDIEAQLRSRLPPNSPDSLSTCIPNLVASRISNRLKLGGVAYVVDAACASSLIALEQGIARLRTEQSDVSVVSGIHLCQIPPFWFVFTHLRALSKTGVVRPFDQRADGLLLGEGAGTVVLKRLSDARAHGDRIHAVIRGIGSASDGGETSVLMPASSGQIRALQAAYRDARVDPDTISYLEAHGTATVAGDPVELETIRSFFGTSDLPTRAIGSVKSMIGHAMPAAGMASLIRTILALSNKIIPPTINSDQPHPALGKTPFYLPLEARPWIHAEQGWHRRAGVSAFGFGGINSHVIVEEYVESVGEPAPASLARPIQSIRKQETELALFSADSVDGLRHQLQTVDRFLQRDQSGAKLADICFSLEEQLDFAQPCKLALICHDIKDLKHQIADVKLTADAGTPPNAPPKGKLFAVDADKPRGKLAILFPGMAIPGLIGNYPKHLLQLAMHFPELRQELDKFESKDQHPEDPMPFSSILNPPSTLPASLRESLKTRLAPPPAFDEQHGGHAVPASQRNLSGVGVVLSNWLGWTLVRELGVKPDMVAGQSFGDLVALAVAKTVDFDTVVRPSIWQTLLDPEILRIPGCMAFLMIDQARVEQLLVGHGDVAVAAYVSPEQVLLGGSTDGIQAVVDQARRQGIMAITLPYVPAHTSHMSHLRARSVGQRLTKLRPPNLPVYSSISGDRFPDEEQDIRALVIANLDQPLHFWETNQKMVRDGARIFIQAGCGSIAGNVKAGLPETDVVAIDIDNDSENPITHVNLLVGTLFTSGVRFDPSLLFRHRPVRRLDLDKPMIDRPPPPEQVHLALEWLIAPEVDTNAESKSSPTPGPTDRLDSDRPDPATPRIPFTGQVNRFVPGRELSITRTFQLDEDLYLQDHCFVKAVGIKPIEQCLPVLPMVMTMELMAEASAYLAPKLGLIAFEKMKALHWIWLEDVSSVEVRVEARLEDGNSPDTTRRIQARVFCADELCATATVLFDCQYREDVKLAFSPIGNPTAWPCRHQQLYNEGYTFHGPRFQSVTEFGDLGENGLTGTLTTLPRHDLFASVRNPELLTDPAVIDGIGQLVGCWAQANNCHVLPIGLEQIELYRPSPKPGVDVPVRIQITRFDRKAHIITADIEVQDGEGFVWMRIRGWSDIILPHSQSMMDVQRLPTHYMVSQQHTIPGLPNEGVITRLGFNELNRGNIQWISRLFLTADELKPFATMTARRQREYLAGRIALKDAVRLWLRQRPGFRPLHPAEIHISTDELGCPHVDPVPETGELPRISVAHSRDTAIAVATTGPCGIDIENTSEGDVQQILDKFASPHERAILDPILQSRPSEAWATRLWCAKEATAKALGLGLQGRPMQFELVEVASGGTARIRFQPDQRDVTVFTIRDRTAVVALALPEATTPQKQTTDAG